MIRPALTGSRPATSRQGSSSFPEPDGPSSTMNSRSRTWMVRFPHPPRRPRGVSSRAPCRLPPSARSGHLGMRLNGRPRSRISAENPGAACRARGSFDFIDGRRRGRWSHAAAQTARRFGAGSRWSPASWPASGGSTSPPRLLGQPPGPRRLLPGPDGPVAAWADPPRGRGSRRPAARDPRAGLGPSPRSCMSSVTLEEILARGARADPLVPALRLARPGGRRGDLARAGPPPPGYRQRSW